MRIRTRACALRKPRLFEFRYSPWTPFRLRGALRGGPANKEPIVDTLGVQACGAMGGEGGVTACGEG